MKVLMFQHLPAPYLVEFLNGIGKYIELTVIFKEKRNKEREDSWLDYNFLNFKAYFLPEKKKISFLNDMLKGKYDLYWNCDYSNPYSIYLTMKFKLRHITVLMHADGGIAIPRNYDFLISKVMNMADFFASSGKVCDRYYDYYHVPKNKRLYYRFTSQNEKDINGNRMMRENRSIYREELKFKDDIVVFSVGQMIPRKGYDILAKAIKYINSNVKIIIAGGYPEDDVKQIIENNHITNMEFIGFKKKDELAKYFAASDIFVLPTRYDIWGLVINEAMSFGLPIISTDKCAAADELISIFDNGIIVPIENEIELAKAIDILANDNELRIQYGINSLNGIKDYTIENMIKDYLVIFDKVKKDESTSNK